jgi:glyoxylase-like metal-dependent hydrolase (beta-lactamase superfamily II)
MNAPITDTALPTAADIEDAALRLDGVAVRTPLLHSDALDAATGGRVFLKPEVLQRTGSFKFRGAYNRISRLTQAERKGGVVAFSSGNHAQGVALAAKLAGVPAVIDPVMDYDHKSGTVDTRSAQAMLAAAREKRLSILWALETHAHADHLSAAPYVKAKTGARIGIGEHIKDVQRIFRPIFNATDLAADGSDFDHLFRDGEAFQIGNLSVEVIYTPGHTPADVSYRIADAIFVGDTLFMPDYGTARADFWDEEVQIARTHAWDW